MKTLLIPTDFTSQSLQNIPVLAQQYYPEKLDIVLVHMLKITDSISELLMLSRRSVEYRHISDSFYEQCRELEKDYSHLINKIHIDFFYGSTVAVFNNYLEAHNVSAMVAPHSDYKMLFKNSIDPQVLIAKCGKRVINITEEVSLTPSVIAEEPEFIDHE